MQVKKTNKSDTEFVLDVTADEEYLARLKQTTLKHLGAKHVKVPGFRPGTAPAHVVEKHIDQSLLQTEFLEEAVNRLLSDAVKAEKLFPVGQPDIQIKKFAPFSQLEFSASLEAAFVSKIGDYKSMRKAKPLAKVSAKDITEVVEALQKRAADKTDVKRPAKDGDEVLIDFAGRDAKGPVNGADGKDYPLALGSNTFIPGFEPNLIGLKAGDEKTFDVTFPKDYGVAALQNKKVTFTVKVHKVSELKEPVADDKFAAKVSPFKTLAELKEDIKKQLLVEKQRETDQLYQNEILEGIANKSTVAVPKVLVDNQVEQAELEERQNLTYRGQTWQEHLAEEGVTEDEHRERNRPSAEQAVKTSLLLTEIADVEAIEVTPEELEIRLQIMKGQYQDPAMQAELDKPESRKEITSRLITEKTINKILGYTAT